MSDHVENPDVLICGAGPVGLAMAIELARYGLSVRIIDKAAEPSDKSKALVIWPRTLELLSRSGVAKSLIAAGFQVTAANITAGSETIAHIELNQVDSPYPFALMLPQSETERILTAHLNSLGVAIERNVELTSFVHSAEEVVSTLNLNAAQQTIHSKWLIGCDGAHSIVRHQLGMHFIGDTLQSNWMLADVHLTHVPAPAEVTVAWHSAGALVIFPITQTRYRIIADIPETPASDQAPQGKTEQTFTLQDVQAVLDQRGPGGITASDPIWLAGFHINERKVADYRAGRVFLAGDAAHIHSPAGGQGMNTGIQDACNLAWKLALVHRRCGAEALLASYTPERSYVGEQVLKAAGRMTAAGILRGDLKQSIRNHIAQLVLGFAPVRHAAANALAELAIGYPDSPLNRPGSPPHGTPLAGERAPIRPSESPAGAGSSPRFALYAQAGPDAAGLNAEISGTARPSCARALRRKRHLAGPARRLRRPGRHPHPLGSSQRIPGQASAASLTTPPAKPRREPCPTGSNSPATPSIPRCQTVADPPRSAAASC